MVDGRKSCFSVTELLFGVKITITCNIFPVLKYIMHWKKTVEKMNSQIQSAKQVKSIYHCHDGLYKAGQQPYLLRKVTCVIRYHVFFLALEETLHSNMSY